MSDTEYRFTVRPLTEDEGGGYLIEFPDLPGCMSDGETIEDAIANAVFYATVVRLRRAPLTTERLKPALA